MDIKPFNVKIFASLFSAHNSQALPVRHYVDNMLSNRYFQVELDNAKSKLKRFNNGLQQGSVLAPTLFNLYLYDLHL